MNIKNTYRSFDDCIALNPELWTLHGVLRIPFLKSQRAFFNEFKKTIDTVEIALGGGGSIYWLINLKGGDTWSEDKGRLLHGHMAMHFVISDMCRGNKLASGDNHEKICHTFCQNWRYEILESGSVDPETHSLSELLDISPEALGRKDELAWSRSLSPFAG